VDIFAFPPIAALLEGAYRLVQFLSSLVHPLVGTAAAAVAIVLLTVLVRAVLIPVSASQVKAEWGRRRIAPRLQALQKKYKKNPELLQRKTLELYRSENVSMFGGFLPTLLLQAPVLSLVYALFLHSTIGGHPNDLLTERLGSVPLGSTLWQAGWPGVLVFVVLFCAMGIVAWFSRRTALRLALPSEGQSTLLRALSWAPFLTIVFAAFVPLAATIYLATTTLWTLIERALLRRRHWGESGSAVGAVLTSS